MFSVKWGVLAGIAAFVLALLTSLLLGQTSLLTALLRALIFAVVFFGLGTGIWILINTYIPELLVPDPGDSAVHDVFSAVQPGSTAYGGQGAPGSRVNITVDDEATPALPDDNGNVANIEEVGNFSDLIGGESAGPSEPGGRTAEGSGNDNSGGRDIDQNPASSYTMEAEEFAPASDNSEDSGQGGFSVDFGAFVSDGGGMGELDSYMDSFSMFSADSGPAEAEEPPPAERKVSKNKPTEFTGDFNPKEIAAGIRTVLEKDKR